MVQIWEGGFTWVTDGPAPAPQVWTSPETGIAFPAAELVVSWNATTQPGSWLLIEARVGDDQDAHEWSDWMVMGKWAADDPQTGGALERTTVADQKSVWGAVDADVFRAAEERRFTRFQVRITAHPNAAGEHPQVRLVAGSASAFDLPAGAERTVSAPVSVGREIAVPHLSQRRHIDTFAHWDSGGQSWCSPTSTTMLLRYWDVAPTEEESRWVGHDIDPDVVHGVRQVFDLDFAGAGNWTFNVAYAATRGLRAYVTRLRSLVEAEQFIAAGVPLVVSVSFEKDELDGAGYRTDGHLLTIVGFTEDGDVISNDPNSHGIAENSQVRSVYRRDQFENVWLGDRGGLTYVMHPRDVALPPAPDEPNWG